MLRWHSGYVKADFVTASRTNWVFGAMALPGNPYDGNTLTEVLAQAETVCGSKPKHAYCDLGYRGHDYKGEVDVQVVNRFRKHKPRALLRWWKRRSAIEPVIGHVKSDYGMDRNMLAGAMGDKINAMLAGVGFNLVKLMRASGVSFCACARRPADSRNSCRHSFASAYAAHASPGTRVPERRFA